MVKTTPLGLIEFLSYFNDDRTCLEFLAEKKWSNGFKCRKCGHDKCTIRKKNLARDCNKCHHIDSPTANTAFHRVRFGIKKAFVIAFEIGTSTRVISATQMAQRFGVSRKTAQNFMTKVRSYLFEYSIDEMLGLTMVMEFAFGNKEDFRPTRGYNPKRKKIVAALEFSESGGVKRMCLKHIENYSSNELRKIFDGFISHKATVITPRWTGYEPLKGEFKIIQKPKTYYNFLLMNYTIHHLKTWLRSTYTSVSDKNLQGYLDAYSFMINNSNDRQSCFDQLITRMIRRRSL
jgi:transposase-like protein